MAASRGAVVPGSCGAEAAKSAAPSGGPRGLIRPRGPPLRTGTESGCAGDLALSIDIAGDSPPWLAPSRCHGEPTGTGVRGLSSGSPSGCPLPDGGDARANR